MNLLRRMVIFALVLVVTVTATACGSTHTGNTNVANGNTTPVSTLTSDVPAPTDEPAKAPQKVDYDLTVLNATMVYAQVFDIMQNPDNYIGKVIKMNGSFEIYVNQFNENMFYPACIIADATACCAQGVEFLMPDGANPIVGNPITVVGIFESYKEDQNVYYHLVDTTVQY